MNCYYHPDLPAVAQCHICHKGFCKDCFDEFSVYRLNNAPCCPDCFVKINSQQTRIAYQQHEQEYKKYRAQVLRYLLMIIAAIVFMLAIGLDLSEFSGTELVKAVLLTALVLASFMAGFDLEKALRGPSGYVVDKVTGQQQVVYEKRGIIGVVIIGLLLGSFVGTYYLAYVVCYKYPSLLIKRRRLKKRIV